MEQIAVMKENAKADNWRWQAYMENKLPGHFKGYAIVVSQTNDGQFVTVGYWGKIGRVNKWQIKYLGESEDKARAVAVKFFNQKLGRGYDLVSNFSIPEYRDDRKVA